MKSRNRYIALAATVAALVVGAGLVAGAATGARLVIMGKTSTNPKPSCDPKPSDSCFAIGSVTGFATKLGDKKRPFVARERGKIVAWSVHLGSKPSNRVPDGSPDGTVSNLQFFQDLFGNENHGKNPVAGIAILNPTGERKKYKLRSKSPPVRLARKFNEDTIFTLDKPLLIGEGQVVALTSYTWLPNIIPQPAGSTRYAWRASRNAGECGASDARDTKPHANIDTIRQYGCKFNDRFFYRAYFVPTN